MIAKLSASFIALTLMIAGTPLCWAAPVLSLSSTTDLNSLVVGQPVTITVNLSGLEADGDQLEMLAATVAYDHTVFGMPTQQSTGSIIPSPLNQPQDMLVANDWGIVDAMFLTFGSSSSNRVQNDGIFYDFTVPVIGSGSGTFSLTHTDAIKPGSHENVLGSSPASSLSFTAVQAPAAGTGQGASNPPVIPEPTTAAAFLLAMGWFTAKRFRK